MAMSFKLQSLLYLPNGAKRSRASPEVYQSTNPGTCQVDCYHKVSQNYENHLLYCHYSMLLHQSRIFFYWQNVSSRTFVKILAEGVMTFVKISSITTLPSSFLPPHNHLATHVSSQKDELFPDGNLGLTPPSIVRYRYTNSCQPLPFSQ